MELVWLRFRTGFTATPVLFIIFFTKSLPKSHSLRPSLEFAEEVEQSAVELAGFVHVTGVSCSCQLHHGVMRQLNQVLMGLGAQIGV